MASNEKRSANFSGRFPIIAWYIIVRVCSKKYHAKCGGLGVFWVELSYKSTKLNVRHGTLLFVFVQKSTMLNVGAKVHKIFEAAK